MTYEDVTPNPFLFNSFSGRRIWIATGLIRGKELEITDCRPAKELPGSGRELQKSLVGLTDFISGQREAIFGMDFPFGLPESIMGAKNWKDFVQSFRKRFSDPKYKVMASVIR